MVEREKEYATTGSRLPFGSVKTRRANAAKKTVRYLTKGDERKFPLIREVWLNGAPKKLCVITVEHVERFAQKAALDNVIAHLAQESAYTRGIEFITKYCPQEFDG